MNEPSKSNHPPLASAKHERKNRCCYLEFTNWFELLKKLSPSFYPLPSGTHSTPNRSGGNQAKMARIYKSISKDTADMCGNLWSSHAPILMKLYSRRPATFWRTRRRWFDLPFPDTFRTLELFLFECLLSILQHRTINPVWDVECM